MKKKIIAKSKDLGLVNEIINNSPIEDIHFIDRANEITEQIYRMLDKMGWKQKDLASAMNKSEAEISKILNGNHNLTLRTIAHIETILKENIILTKAGIELEAEKAGQRVHMLYSTIARPHSKVYEEDSYADCNPSIGADKKYQIAAA
jgi:transcriptional regulator with XRE-family HTH domain